jgi:hypothetical protein
MLWAFHGFNRDGVHTFNFLLLLRLLKRFVMRFWLGSDVSCNDAPVLHQAGK